MTVGTQQHWDSAYDARPEDELTWFEATPALSRDLVKKYLEPGEAFIDVGGGASRLVDVLLDEGFGPLAVLDISTSALAVSKERLGARSEEVVWIDGDVTTWQPDRAYVVWHDRAVFHFLIKPDARAAYAHVMARALETGGIAVIATFAEDGPEMCSGLPVVRYAPGDLAREFDKVIPGRLEMVEARRHVHITPKGNRQSFQYSVFRKVTWDE